MLRRVWKQILYVAVGGGLGSVGRFLISTVMLRAIGPSFAWGTLTVNLAGSFLIALFMHLGLSATVLPADARLFLTTGVMGGFTTYSTFSYETTRYLQDGAYALAGANVGVTLVGGLLACIAGFAAGRAITG